jgi:23S rRNA pseudouridine1911/1915/1917 synthase
MNKSFAHDSEVNDSKKAVLHYKKLKDLDRYTVLEITLETGRHHQIRSQLTHIGFPIKGDLKYGAKRSNPDGSIDLHARSLTIDHPTTKERINIVAPPPARPQWNFALSD